MQAIKNRIPIAVVISFVVIETLIAIFFINEFNNEKANYELERQREFKTLYDGVFLSYD
jgi:hypothetical protein